MAAYAMEHYASPGRGGYRAAMLASDAVYDCRKELAELFEAKAGGHCLYDERHTRFESGYQKRWSGRGTRLSSRALSTTRSGGPLVQIGANVKLAGRKLFDPDDTLEAFRAAIGPETKAVVCTHVSKLCLATCCRSKKSRRCVMSGVFRSLSTAHSRRGFCRCR